MGKTWLTRGEREYMQLTLNARQNVELTSSLFSYKIIIKPLTHCFLLCLFSFYAPNIFITLETVNVKYWTVNLLNSRDFYWAPDKTL